MLQDFYTKLSNQEKMFLYWTLGFIVLAGFDFLFWQPASSKLQSLDAEISQTKDDIKRDVRYLAYKDKIHKENEIYSVYQPDEKKTEDQVFSAFLGTVENFAREVEVNPGKLNPGDIIVKKGYAQYFANMECSGKFENIVKLIHKIDTTPNLLKVVKLNIVGKKSSADEVTVVMKISKLIIDPAVSSNTLQAGLDNPSGKRPLQNNNSNIGQSAGGEEKEGGATGKTVGPIGSGGGGGLIGTGGGGDLTGTGGGGGGGSEGGAGGSTGSGGGGGLTGTGGGGGSTGLGGGSGARGNKSGTRGTGSGRGGGGGNEGEENSSTDAGGRGTSASQTDKGKEATSKNNSGTEKREPARMDKISSGERMEVNSLESLWNNFWGIKPKVPVERPLTEDEIRELNSSEDQMEEESGRNLLRNVLERKK